MNDFQNLRQQAEKYKQLYPPGTRLELQAMNDPYAPVESGTRGRGTLFFEIARIAEATMSLVTPTRKRMLPFSALSR